MGGQALIAACAALALVGSTASLWLMLRSGLADRMLDEPNHRSLHARPIPRVGGVAIAVGVALAALVFWPQAPGALRLALGCALALALVSGLDDLRNLPVTVRFVAHLGAALVWCWATGIPALWLPVAVLLIGWSTNLYNFMDGADGLAGGMAAIGFGAYAIAFAMAGTPGAAAISAAIAAASLGFLSGNAPPARVFMGDSGSIPLGFLAAVLGIEGYRSQTWSAIFPLLVFLPFWFDATVTLGIRLLRGRRPWEAHRDHFYQKAVRSGLGHRTSARGAWLLMFCCAGAALVSQGLSSNVQGWILTTAVAVLIGVALAIERLWRRKAIP